MLTLTLKDIVDHYLKCYKPSHDEELKRSRDFLNTSGQPDLEIAEVLLIGNHQIRLQDIHSWQPYAKKAIGILAKQRPWMKKYRDFDDIYSDVNRLIGSIKFIGPLAVYDVSLRLAARFNSPIVMPNKVYLTTGPLKAAKIMNANGTMRVGKIGNSSVILDKKLFPVDFHRLTCEDIEDLLCTMEHYDVFSNYANLLKVPCPAKIVPFSLLLSRLKGSRYI